MALRFSLALSGNDPFTWLAAYNFPRTVPVYVQAERAQRARH
jgi:hypothetical protein